MADMPGELICNYLEKFIVYQKFKVVESVKDNKKEISENDPLIKNGKIENDAFFFPINIEKLPFFFVQNIRNRYIEKITEIEKEIKKKRQLDFFEKNKNKLVLGKTVSFFSNYCEIEIKDENNNEIFGVWPKEEWSGLTLFKNEEKNDKSFYYYFLVKDIEYEKKNIILSRNDNVFLKKILEKEVLNPELGHIKIKQIIRKPGFLTKIIVDSSTPTLNKKNVIGAFIGLHGSRKKEIEKNLYENEKLEIVVWDDNKNRFILNFLSPIKIISIIGLKKDTIKIVVPESDIIRIKKNRGWLVNKISEIIKKNLVFSTYEQEVKKDSFIVWNGSFLNEKEYSKYLKNNYLTKKEKSSNDWTR